MVILGFPSGTSGKEHTCQCRRHRDVGLIPGLGRSPGRGHGNSLLYSGLRNPMDRGAWQGTLHGVTSVASDPVWLRGVYPARLLCPWDSPGQNTGVGSGPLLQGIFPTQGLNPGLRIADGFFTNWATREAPAEEGKRIFWSWHFWTYRIIPADGLLSILKWYHFGWEPYILFFSSNKEVGCLKNC